MISKIIKRDGRVASFDDGKIFAAVVRAVLGAKEKYSSITRSTTEIADEVTDNVLNTLEVIFDGVDEEVVCPSVEQIQDIVVRELAEVEPIAAEHYQEYRTDRTNQRVKEMQLIKAIQQIGKETTRDNANVGNNFSAKLLQIASEGSKAVNLLSLPGEIAAAHLGGDIHIHDLDSYNLSINCLQIDTEAVLKRGFNTGYGTINPPKRIESAAALSCIILQSSQNDMYGGQSHFDFDNAMASFVASTERCIRQEILHIWPECPLDQLEEKTQEKLAEQLKQAMQIVVYNLNSMHSRAGSQVPFSTINVGKPRDKYAAMVCAAFLTEFERGLGKGEPAIFPNIVFHVKKGVNFYPQDPFYHLLQLAIRVAARRMNPTFQLCDSTFNRDKDVATMGCRTRIEANVNGEKGSKRRGNIAPVSINLVRLALNANKQVDSALFGQEASRLDLFWARLDDVLRLCEKQLLHRYDVLKGLKGKDLPFIVGEKLVMGSEDVGPEDSIEPILKNGTYGIGFIGLAETLMCLLGEHHGESIDALAFGHRIVQHIRGYCDHLVQKHRLNFTCYATPAEGLAGRFVAIDRVKFGYIQGVTDKAYYTNSFHIPVAYNLPALEKFKIESRFHELCNAGHISYVRLDRPPVDCPWVIDKMLSYAVESTNAGYIGFDFAICYCKACGADVAGDVCAKCGGGWLQKIDRVTGYLSLAERFPDGKSAERKDRIAHQLITT